MAADTMARRERDEAVQRAREKEKERSIFNERASATLTERGRGGRDASNYITAFEGVSINSQKRKTPAARSDYTAERGNETDDRITAPRHREFAHPSAREKERRGFLDIEFMIILKHL